MGQRARILRGFLPQTALVVLAAKFPWPFSSPQRELPESSAHALAVEDQRAEALQFADWEVFGHLRIGLEDSEEIRVLAAGVLDLPGFHGVALDQRVGLFARQAGSPPKPRQLKAKAQSRKDATRPG